MDLEERYISGDRSRGLTGTSGEGPGGPSEGASDLPAIFALQSLSVPAPPEGGRQSSSLAFLT